MPWSRYKDVTSSVKMTIAKSMFVILCAIFLVNSIKAEAPGCDPDWSRPSPKEMPNIINWKSLSNIFKESYIADETTLKLVHVVLRHGDRGADADALYPLDPYINYTYPPNGPGQLSNLGKRQEYKIGQYLRQRYDKFLGNVYTPNSLDPVSTAYNRTKMSLQLVLAGLWPPTQDQIWNNELLWQPIPYNYEAADRDMLLGDPAVTCNRYRTLLAQYLKSSEYTNENDKLKDFYEYFSVNTGLNITNQAEVYTLFFTLFAEEQFGLTLPPWTKCVWPKKVTDVAVSFYNWLTFSNEVQRLTIGKLLEKIINDSNNAKLNDQQSDPKKMFIYSGHERNVALVLAVLNLFHPHMPPYASYVLIEFHKINEVYGFKVFYQDYEGKAPKLLTIPNCDSFCPYDQFYKLLKDKLPREQC